MLVYQLTAYFRPVFPAVGPWTWGTNVHVLNGHHAIQVDAYTCSGGNPNYHAAVDVNVNN
jgi:hypothetical protein